MVEMGQWGEGDDGEGEGVDDKDILLVLNF